MNKPILIERNVAKYRRWPLHKYRCACGNEFVCLAGRVNSGNTKSCGCIKRSLLIERNKRVKRNKHGHASIKARSGVYKSWLNMIARCTNPKNTHYAYYGGRGIKVYDAWRKFENFLADMGERPEGATIDRIDNNSDYEPGNCRWATRKEQVANRRPFRGRNAYSKSRS